MPSASASGSCRSHRKAGPCVRLALLVLNWFHKCLFSACMHACLYGLLMSCRSATKVTTGRT